MGQSCTKRSENKNTLASVPEPTLIRLENTLIIDYTSNDSFVSLKANLSKFYLLKIECYKLTEAKNPKNSLLRVEFFDSSSQQVEEPLMVIIEKIQEELLIHIGSQSIIEDLQKSQKQCISFAYKPKFTLNTMSLPELVDELFCTNYYKKGSDPGKSLYKELRNICNNCVELV